MRKLVVVLLLLVSTASVAQEEVLKNEDVLRMHHAGLPPAVIIAKIDTSATDFDTSVEALVALGNAGLSGDVVARMTTAGTAAQQPARQSQPVVVGGRLITGQLATVQANKATLFTDPHCPGPGIFVATSDGVEMVEASAYLGTKTTGAWKRVLPGGGFMSVKAKAMLQGTTSNNRIGERSPIFYFCFEEEQTGLSYETTGATGPSQFVLAALDVNPRQNARMIVTGKSSAYANSLAGPPPKYRRSFTHEKLAPGVYRVSVNGLTPGEYAFYFTGSSSSTMAQYGVVSTDTGGGKVFDFSIM